MNPVLVRSPDDPSARCPPVDAVLGVEPWASLAPRASRPNSTPAAAAPSRNVPGRRRAKSRTSSRMSEGSRPSSRAETSRAFCATWRATSPAMPLGPFAAICSRSSPKVRAVSTSRSRWVRDCSSTITRASSITLRTCAFASSATTPASLRVADARCPASSFAVSVLPMGCLLSMWSWAARTPRDGSRNRSAEENRRSAGQGTKCAASSTIRSLASASPIETRAPSPANGRTRCRARRPRPREVGGPLAQREPDEVALGVGDVPARPRATRRPRRVRSATRASTRSISASLGVERGDRRGLGDAARHRTAATPPAARGDGSGATA